jgi:type IV secretion/conjugal transfer VirB4 family ATPase
MLRLSKIVKNFKETGALNENVSIYGFLDDQVFLTKGGDVGAVLRVEGVDYECLDHKQTDSLTKRLESALRLLGPQFRVYQLLFKSSGETIPHGAYDNPVVRQAVNDRTAFFEKKAGDLYSLRIYYVILYEGAKHQAKLTRSLLRLTSDPKEAVEELKGFLSSKKQTVLIDSAIEKQHRLLLHQVRSLILQLSDFVNIEVGGKQEVFSVMKRLLNFSPMKIEHTRLKYNTHVDYYVADSAVECYPGHLLIDDCYVKVLTLKEPTAQSWPLILRQLLEVGASFHIVTEWKAQDNTVARKRIQSMRRHFHNGKTSLFSQLKADNSTNPGDLLVDDSKESLVRSLGECLKEIELNGNYFGEFSLTVVVHDKSLSAVEKACAEFYKVFSMHDGLLFEERYNLLNAFFATLPGNRHFNLRYLWLLNATYADYSFLFTLHTGERRNKHLNAEYLAVLETNHGTPYFLNLHYQDTAHTIVLGRTGSGKSFFLNFLITNLQKYAPYTFIFDLGGSFRSITQLFGGAYLKVSAERSEFTINPFSLEPSRENLNFLFSLIKVLAEGRGLNPLSQAEEKDLYTQIQNLYVLPANLRTLSVLANTLQKSLAVKLEKWVRGGQYEQVFDNEKDTLTLSPFQCFDFEGMDRYPELIEPLLFYILHRANAYIHSPEAVTTFKTFFIDEAWRFFGHPTIRNYIVEALKTWRKKNAAMILSTQSLDELDKSEIVNVVIESCATKIFLANPDMDRDLYRNTFHLNDNEIEMISTLIPKRQALVKRPDLAKVVNLEVDEKSYWLYTSDPNERFKREQAFREHGFEKGLEVLAGSSL